MTAANQGYDAAMGISDNQRPTGLVSSPSYDAASLLRGLDSQTDPDSIAAYQRAIDDLLAKAKKGSEQWNECDDCVKRCHESAVKRHLEVDMLAKEFSLQSLANDPVHFIGMGALGAGAKYGAIKALEKFGFNKIATAAKAALPPLGLTAMAAASLETMVEDEMALSRCKDQCHGKK